MGQPKRPFLMVSLTGFLLIILVTYIFIPLISASDNVNSQILDEFEEINLDSEWIWINPTGNCTYSLTANPGHLRIYVPKGNYDLGIPWLGTQNAPRMVRSIAGDFVIETRLSIEFKYDFQFAGILIWGNNTHFVRFQIGYRDAYPQQVVEAKAIHATPTVGGWIVLGTITLSGDATALRVQRGGGRFTFEYSMDGATWIMLASETLGVYQTSLDVGFFAVSQEVEDTIHVDFDYFKAQQQPWPSQPLNLAAQGEDKQIALSWSPPLDNGGVPIQNYNVYRSNESGKEEFLIAVGNITVYTDEGLINGQHYYYKVSAVNNFGEGMLSEEVSAMPVLPQFEYTPQWNWAFVLVMAAVSVILLVSKRMLGWKVSNFYNTLKRRKRSVVIVLAWSLALGLIFIKTYWFFYFRYPMFYEYGNPSFKSGGPKLDLVDTFLLFVVSLTVGMLLNDLESTIIGYVASMILSFSMGFVYSLIFVWSILGWGAILQPLAYGWEWAILWAVVNIGRIMFPIAFVFCLLGGISGTFLRNWTKP